MFQGLIVYILTFILLFIIWIFVLGYFPFLLCLLFVLLFIISLFISYAPMKKTKVSIEVQTSVVQKNEIFKLIFHRESHTFVDCGHVIIYYEIIDAFGNRISHGHLRLVNQTVSKNIHIRYAGAYHVVIKKILCYDILRCLYRKHQPEVTCQFYVFPLFQPQQTLLQENTGFHNEANEYSPYLKGQDYSEVIDLRPYRDSDLLKHIHWKATLKKNELYVKEGGQPIIKKILLTVHLSQSQSLNDMALERFYSLCLTLIQRQIDFEIVCPNSFSKATIELIKNDIHFKECFQLILKFSIQDLDKYLKTIDDYPEIYIVNAQGIEVYH